MTQRVVIDANVFVSAAIARGAAYRIVTAWLDHQPFELIICPAILAEVTDVLARPRVAKRLSADLAALFVRSIRIAADVVDDPPDGDVSITRYSDDDYLIRLARAHDADLIVSGDKDVLEWTEQRPPVMSPAAFEQLIA
jgi:uncharacterized protein